MQRAAHALGPHFGREMHILDLWRLLQENTACRDYQDLDYMIKTSAKKNEIDRRGES